MLFFYLYSPIDIKMKQTFFVAIFFLILFNSCRNSNRLVDERYVVVLSMDGFRWDYASRTSTPNLDKIAQSGVKAERMIPSFTTTTFANHYALATGLYPAHHGIVLNSFYATDLKEYYNSRSNKSSVGDERFYGGEPIWATAEMQGVKTATFFWVGSEAPHKGVRPTYWKPYEHNLPYAFRIDTVIAWLAKPKELRPKLIMWYFDEPDSSGHDLGPENDSILPIITRLDSLVGVFMDKMATLPHADKINFIVVSDHGMAQLYPEKRIILDQFVDTSMFERIDGYNPTMNFKVKNGMLEKAIEKFKLVPHIRFWKRGEGPAHLNHGNNIRTHDLTVLADDGWSIYWSYAIGNARGTHGYDNKNKDMHAIFYAMGPDFKSNFEKKPFQNIHLYPLMTHLLKLQPAKIDGRFDSIADIIKVKR